jgi:hypothetical protein
MTAPHAAASGGRVPARRAARLAWLLCAASLTLMTLSIMLLLLWRGARFPLPRVDWSAGSWAEQLAAVVGSLGAPVLGAIITSYQPRNRYGWVWCAIGLTAAVGSITAAYAGYALLTVPGLPGAVAVAWLSNSVTWAAQALWLFAWLLFPDGRLPSPRWRPVGWAAGIVLVGSAVLAAIAPGPLASFPFVTNPVGIGGAAVEPVTGTLGFLFWNIWVLLAVVVAPVAVLMRFWRARGQERQQLKWFAVVGVLALGQVVATDYVQEEDHPLATAVVAALLSWAIYAAIGIAVLRHRLYDIDRLLNRTLVYGLLTALLGVGYAGLVLVLSQMFGGVTSDPPSWAVAGATLAVAALFQPARRYVQHAVDRRFNRHRYDTAKTIEAFSARLRDQIDLDTLSRELLAVVDQTMEPTTASLWLRPPVKR